MVKKDKRNSSHKKASEDLKNQTFRKTRRDRTDNKAKRYSIVFGKSILIIVLVAILFGILYFVKGLMDTNELLDKSYSPRTKTIESEKIDVQKDPISILLLGLDDNEERNIGSARTDSMLLLTINPTNEKISMVSIPRDTYTEILSASSYEGKDKINAAFAYGGIDATIDTVENLIDVPINYYATFDFQAFENIVNALDGVDIDVPFTLTEQNAAGQQVVNLTEGKHKLNGEEALAFARTRHIDDDIERGKRQQQVLEAISNKAMNVGTISKYKSILEALDGHIKTDMPSNIILAIAQSGLTRNYTFDSYVFSWFGFDYAPYGDAISMVGLYQDSLDYITHRLRLSLELDQPDDRDVEGYQFETDGIVDEDTFPNDGMATIN